MAAAVLLEVAATATARTMAAVVREAGTGRAMGEWEVGREAVAAALGSVSE